ncbi:MAG: bifunctional DNA primase/polymerase [Anaerolineae bacterium]|nr:bifunctional DNA primase/polymerase [Anaerolineae bacterium]
MNSPGVYQAALGYLHNCYGIIPVHTDPERAKVAAVPWALYQQRRATPDELHTWFVTQRYTGLAIVTGVVSGLIVLDFDDPKLFDYFRQVCPDLTVTYMVRTRRGVHLYFRTSQIVPSRKGQGLDLKAQGGYVVAPPTKIGSYTYTVVGDDPPRNLSATDLSRIQAFISALATPTAVPRTVSQEPAFSCEIQASQEVRRQPQGTFIRSSGLENQYRYQATQGSRNEALFRISLRARDLGYDLQTAIDLLADLHARQPGNADHRRESYRQRYREAVATIRSAYSRPPRRQQGRGVSQQLPNSVREKLFELKQTYTVRVIDGLRLVGFLPGQPFTTQQAVLRLRGRVGRDSVYQALKATSGDGRLLFERVSPSGHPQRHAHADGSLSYRQTKECVLVGKKSQEKGLYHRPAHIYVMPTNEELCLKLGVPMTGSDALTEQDLSSAKQTRMAAHRELIRRRPGMYPRRWLARRLGVGTDTLDAYNRDIPIQVRHCYAEKAIGWYNLHDIPLALDLPGTFLEDDTGKRYPAKREIARKLLAWKHVVVYKKQDVNYYWYSDTEDAPPIQSVAGWLPPGRNRFPEARPWPSGTGSSADVPTVIPQSQVDTGGNRSLDGPPAKMPPPVPASFRDRAAEDRLAERVYRTVKRLSADKAQRISKANAQRLVETYGVAAVEQGLKQLKWYTGKGRVTRPAGFLVTASRLAWRELHSGANGPTPVPRFSGKKYLQEGGPQ